MYAREENKTEEKRNFTPKCLHKPELFSNFAGNKRSNR